MHPSDGAHFITVIRIPRRLENAAFHWMTAACVWAAGFRGAAAAFEELATDARTAAMGAAFIASRGPGSALLNPAGIGEPASASVCFSSAVPFGLGELAVHSCCGSVPSRLGSLGLALSTCGRSPYRENTVAAAWSVRFEGRILAGIALRGLNLRIDRFGSWTGVALDASARISLGDRWTFGFSGTDLNQARVEKCSPVPQVTRIGFVHVPAKGVSLAAEIEKDFRYPAGFRGGFEWIPFPGFALRSGFSRAPAQFACGFGIAWNGFGLDYACTVHPVLGSTHQATIRFDPSARK